MKDSFLSVVENFEDHGTLVVRARVKGHIEKVFPKAKVKKTPDADYMYRAVVPREEVAEAIKEKVMGISYYNFKDAVLDRLLHDTYLDVWGSMFRLQNRLHRGVSSY